MNESLSPKELTTEVLRWHDLAFSRVRGSGAMDCTKVIAKGRQWTVFLVVSGAFYLASCGLKEERAMHSELSSPDDETVNGSNNLSEVEAVFTVSPHKIGIIGGETRDSEILKKLPKQFSSLIKFSYGRFSCTGFRLDAYRYGTAAHCLEFLKKGDTIRIHRGIYAERTWSSKIKSVRIHPKYSSGPSRNVYLPTADLGVFEINRYVSYGDIATSILCANAPPEGSSITVAGYGSHDRNSSQGGSLSFINNVILGDACRLWTRKTCDGTERYLKEGTVWDGDSGGPVYWQDTKAIVGVIDGSNTHNDIIATITDQWMRGYGGKFYTCNVQR